jgi:hypothetical protein
VSRLRSPVGLGRAAAALLGLVVAVDLFVGYAGLALYDVTGDLMNGATGGAVLRRVDAAESLDSLAWKVHSGSVLVCVIVYVSWFVLVRGNAEVFDPAEQSMKSWWAVVGWFAPGLNLWYPRRITLEIWDASRPPAGAGRSHLLVNVWWTLWLLLLFAYWLSDQHYEKNRAPDYNQAVLQLSLFADAVEIAAGALAIPVVLRLTRMQRDKALAGPGAPLTV